MNRAHLCFLREKLVRIQLTGVHVAGAPAKTDRALEEPLRRARIIFSLKRPERARRAEIFTISERVQSFRGDSARHHASLLLVFVLPIGDGRSTVFRHGIEVLSKRICQSDVKSTALPDQCLEYSDGCRPWDRIVSISCSITSFDSLRLRPNAEENDDVRSAATKSEN